MNKTINIKELINKINHGENINNSISEFDIVLGSWGLYNTIKIYDANKKYIAYIQYNNNRIHSVETMRFNEYNYKFILD